ncbi:multimerin-2 isoform X2 [Sphaerodactylus townsendi]|uniref:multimerin-2 isoform X2 n=1 Tax=Sphaerodactylus townsendi TaxID=933632 RepID=UPI00202742DE|nr:multimerin-2 isoform X2 [Sphaerodactylus townsendi]
MIAAVLLLCGTIGLVQSDTAHLRHLRHGTPEHRLPTNSWHEHHRPREFLHAETWDQASTPPTSRQGEADDYEAVTQQFRQENWCSYTQSRLVTYVGVCTTEKYVIKSQQPCPHGTPDCQKIMYRTAVRPIYQIKQKVQSSVHWKCCPGYTGKNCEHYDPNFFPAPTTKPGGWEAAKEAFSSQITTLESQDLLEAHQSHEAQLEDLQNDIHQATSNLGILQKAFHYNISRPRVEASRNQTGAQEQFLQQIVASHVESFLKEHFNPVWSSFNKSLQDLSIMLKNLSQDVEANRKSIEKFQESTVPKKDFQELGTKFESKIQENVWRVDQMKRDIDAHLHLQRTAMHYNLTMIKADTDTKLKRYHKIQHSSLLALNNSLADMRQEQDYLRNDLETLNRNLAGFPAQHSNQNEETTQTGVQILNQTLAGHTQQLKELYEETDEFYDDMNKLQVSMNAFKASSKSEMEELRVALIEKSLIIEEYKEDLERKILALNDSLENIRESHLDLERSTRACHCIKLPSDLDSEEHANATRAIREEMKQFEARLKALKNEIDDLATAFRLFHQPLDFQQKLSRELEGEVSLLKAQTEALSEDIGVLRKTDERVHWQVKYLNSSFNSLLVDAMRHETALEALLGEEIMERLTEEDPSSLISSLDQLQEVFRLILDNLEKENITMESLMKKMHSLEMARGTIPNDYKLHMHPTPEKQIENTVKEDSVQHGSVEHMEPNHEAAMEDIPDNPAYHDIMILKKEIGHLSREMKKYEFQRDRANPCCNHTVVNMVDPLNVSLENLREELELTKKTFDEHLQIFQKLFGSNQELASTNVSLDVAKIQSMMGRQMRKQLKVQERQKTRDRNEANHHGEGTLNGRNKIQTESLETDSPVAFYVKYPEGREGLSLNRTYLNYGDGYFPEHGYFKSPLSGVYMVAVSMEFSPGTAQLVFSNGHRMTVTGSKKKKGYGGGTMTAFALVELKKEEHMWFELLQGSTVTRNPAGMSMVGFLIFKT